MEEYKYKYYKYKNKYYNLLGGINPTKFKYKNIKKNTILYRVRNIYEDNIPEFNRPLFFVDDPINLFYILQWRKKQTPEIDIKKLSVDLFIVNDNMSVININNNFTYNDIENIIYNHDNKYEKSFLPYDGKNIDGDNIHVAKNLNQLNIFNGWYDDKKYNGLMNEIMLLPKSKKYIHYIKTKKITDILDKILK
jgi:hypothetical protein